MTKIKMTAKMGQDAVAGLVPHADEFYNDMSTRAFAIVELAVKDRRQSAPDTDEEPEVKVRIVSLEVAPEDQALAVRRIMYALRAARTSEGTLTEGTDAAEVAKAVRDASS